MQFSVKLYTCLIQTQCWISCCWSPVNKIDGKHKYVLWQIVPLNGRAHCHFSLTFCSFGIQCSLHGTAQGRSLICEDYDRRLDIQIDSIYIFLLSIQLKSTSRFKHIHGLMCNGGRVNRPFMLALIIYDFLRKKNPIIIYLLTDLNTYIHPIIKINNLALLNIQHHLFKW